MKFDKRTMLLYGVTDRTWVGDRNLYNQVEEAIHGGATCIQLREKDLDEDSFLSEAIEIRKLCNKYSVPFIINDNVPIAVKSGADGVHVGQSDMTASDVRKLIGEGMILGVSVQTVEQAISAEKMGADYLGVGAVFSTSTKTDANLVSHDTLRDISKSVSIPMVAIGGIGKSNLMELIGTGIDGVALVSAIFASDDIESECRELRALAEKMVNR